MLKSLLLGGALALALPALAQTVPDPNPDADAPDPNLVVPDPVGTAPTDHDPTAEDAAPHQVATPPVGTQVHGGITSSAVAVEPAAAVGGPYEPARTYPVCTRTVTDSCLQLPSSPRKNPR